MFAAHGSMEQITATTYLLSPGKIKTRITPSVGQVVHEWSDVRTIKLRTFNDFEQVARKLASHEPVIMDLSGMDRAEVRRAADFAVGLVLGLRGNLERITATTYLLMAEDTKVDR